MFILCDDALDIHVRVCLGFRGNNAWTSYSVTSPIKSRNDACSWYYKDVLYMFGGGSINPDKIEDGLYMLNLTAPVSAYAWTKLSLPNEPPGRFGAGCKIVEPYQDANGVWVTKFQDYSLTLFGGHGNTGYLNDMYQLNLVKIFQNTSAWTVLNTPQPFPSPRSYMSFALIGLTMFVFGGMGAQGLVLGDTWTGVIVVTSATNIDTLQWVSPTILSPFSPLPRAYHSASGAQGSVYMFGGCGNGVGSTLPIYGDLWRFTPALATWTQLFPSGAIPTPRYAHTVLTFSTPYLSSTGKLLYQSMYYIFGGITTQGTVNELWTYNVNTNGWQIIKAAFPGAAWPGPRAFHDTAPIGTVVSAAILAQMRLWQSNISSFATSLLNTYTNEQFPPSSNSAYSASAYYKLQVQTFLQTATTQYLPQLAVGSSLTYLMVYVNF